MKSFACYCQKCRAANVPGEEACTNCGTPLMLIVSPPSTRNEMIWSDVSAQEHLLERISLLELRLTQVADRLSQALDLITQQSKTAQKEHLLIETLMHALTVSGVIENGAINRLWREKKKNQEERRTVAGERLEKVQQQILAKADAVKAEPFAHLVKDGFRLIASGEEKQGVRLLERAAALEPQNFPLLSFLGEHFFQADKRVLASDYLEKARRIEPAHPRISLLLGVISADRGELKTAQALLEPLGETKSFAANFVLGMIYAAERRWLDTVTAFKRALAIQPNAATHYLVGSACVEAGREKNALKHLQKAVELDANFADAWFMLGAVYLRLGDQDGAKSALSQCLSARDLGAQSQAILRNPKKFTEIAETTLIFRMTQSGKNLIGGSSPRFVKLLREDLENAPELKSF